MTLIKLWSSFKVRWLQTELAAHVAGSFVTGLIPFTVTMHAPHPPSKHMNFVPRKLAWVRMYVFKEVSTGTVDALTEIQIIPMNINTNKNSHQLLFMFYFQLFVMIRLNCWGSEYIDLWINNETYTIPHKHTYVCNKWAAKIKWLFRNMLLPSLWDTSQSHLRVFWLFASTQ